MTDAQLEEEIEAGTRCVRCHALFAPGDERITGGGINPVTNLPQTRAIHGPAGDPACAPAPTPSEG